jgi:hypothetical protein
MVGLAEGLHGPSQAPGGGTQLHPDEVKQHLSDGPCFVGMIANSTVYRDGSKLHVGVKPDDLEGIREAVQSGQPGEFVSLGLHEPDDAEMARVAEIFSLHRLAVEDSLHPVQRPKLEKYGDMVFLVLKTLCTSRSRTPSRAGRSRCSWGRTTSSRCGKGRDSSSKASATTWKSTPMCSGRVPPLSSTLSATGS